MKILITLAALLIASPVIAGEASYTKKFKLDARYDDVIRWMDNHGKTLHKRSNTEILDEGTDWVKLKMRAFVGTFVYRIETETSKRRNTAVYANRTTKVYEGDLKDQFSRLTFRKKGNKTEVEVYCSAEIDHPLASSFFIRRDLVKSANHTEKTLRKHLE